MKTALMMMLVVALMAACGGSSGTAQPRPQVTALASGVGTTQSSNDTVYPPEVVGIGLGVTNPQTLAHPLIVKIVAQPGSAGYSNASVALDSATGLPSMFNVTLQNPASLVPGVYTATFAIEFCLDPDCKEKLATSPDPLVLSVVYTIN